jgi:hypothetical protein
MTTGMGSKADPKGANPAGKTDREARLKAALKSNMAKRKAQAKKRAAQGGTGSDSDA